MIVAMTIAPLKKGTTRGITQNQIRRSRVSGLGREPDELARSRLHQTLEDGARGIRKSFDADLRSKRRPPNRQVRQARALNPVQVNVSGGSVEAIYGDPVTSASEGRKPCATPAISAEDVIIAGSFGQAAHAAAGVNRKEGIEAASRSFKSYWD